MNQVIIYSLEASPRLTYICSLLFQDLLGTSFRITKDVQDYTDSKGIKLNYSTDNKLIGHYIQPHGLLFESDVKPITPYLGNDWLGIPTLILGQNENFDIFASSFYLVSRYEEYLPFVKDTHHRFSADVSCLSRLNLLERPIINEWALSLSSDLKKLNPTYVTAPRSFEYQSTIDIDQAWKFKNKGFFRNVGGFFRDLSKLNWYEVKDRISVLIRNKPDPFYNFDWQDIVHQNVSHAIQYFIQIGSLGRYDKNISVDNHNFQRLIKRLDATYSVGIHPSYQSNESQSLMQHEHHILENVVGHDVKVSRQHFLMHRMPATYQNLIETGIKEDHTMGYSTHMGFRAGIAAPFMFFDLKLNEVTKLKLVPFCCMDITPLHYRKESVDQTITSIKRQINVVHGVGGLFVSLWHNESLSENGRWIGWRVVYEEMITHLKSIKPPDGA
ncbi:MAG: hypothetical protein ACI9JN_001693 [Bacteroidia bacterium]